MRLTANYRAYCLILGWSLVLWLGLYSSSWAAAPTRKVHSKKPPQRSSKTLLQAPKGKKPSTTKKKEQPSPALPLKKPKLLTPAQGTHEDPLLSLDALIVRQPVTLTPYVPLIQTIDLALDYGNLLRGLWPPMTHRYEGELSVLGRKNIQISVNGGYNSLAPPSGIDEAEKHSTAGFYYRLGLDYFVKYNLRDNLYAGLRHSRSHFKHCIQSSNPAKDSVSRNLKASWWEMVIGSEHQLFSHWNLYAGFVIRLKGLRQFEAFESAANYVVPGYGINVQPMVPGLMLYIKYKISFLEKQVTFQ